MTKDKTRRGGRVCQGSQNVLSSGNYYTEKKEILQQTLIVSARRYFPQQYRDELKTYAENNCDTVVTSLLDCRSALLNESDLRGGDNE